MRGSPAAAATPVAVDLPVLFILGAPRSGTSLLYRTLSLHPDAAWINNYWRRAPAVPLLGLVNRVAARTPRLRHRVWFGAEGDNAYRYDTQRTLIDRLYPQPVEGEPIFERRDVLLDEDGIEPDSTQRRLAGDLARFRRAAGGSVLVSKRIGHNRRIRLLHEIFPAARFVVMTRDGRAAARSMLKVDWWADSDIWWAGCTPRAWVADGGDEIELAALHWVHEVEAIESGLADLPADQVHYLTYEGLVAGPSESLGAVAAFAGLGEDARWRAALSRVSFPDHNRIGREPASDRAVEEFQADTLRRWGYLT